MRRWTCLAVAFLVLLGPTPRCQTRLATLRGDSGWFLFGWALAGGRDVDHDGWPDLLIGAPDSQNAGPGRARLVSGRTLLPLFSFGGSGPFDELGHAVAFAGDVNGDGFEDLVVGAPGMSRYAGAALLFSGRDGRLLRTLLSPLGVANEGFSVAGLGDVDRDGIPDLLTGAVGGGTTLREGAATVWSGLTGQILFSVPGIASGDVFGWRVTGLGDVNGDGIPDFAASAQETGTGRRGYVRVHSGTNGQMLYSVQGDASQDRFGWTLANVGDVDRDLVNDFAVGAPTSTGMTGYVRVFSGRNGRVLYTFRGTGARDNWGMAVSGAGDVDGDGAADIACGLSEWGLDTTSLRAPGAVVVLSGRTGTTLLQANGTDNSRVGYAVAPCGDLNRDGHPDLLASGVISNACWVFSGTNVSPIGAGCAPGSNRPMASAFVPVLGQLWGVHGTGASPLAPGLLLFGAPLEVPVPLAALGCSWTLATNPLVPLAPLLPDQSGAWLRTVSLPRDPSLQGAQAGVQAVFVVAAPPFLETTNGVWFRFQP